MLPGRSTILKLFLDKWTKGLDNYIHADAIYCDFMKAFDIVPHQRLLRLFRFYNPPENNHKWIKDFLSEREQQVTANNLFSKQHNIISSLTQRYVLGHVLFIAYTNKLSDGIESSDILLFC